MSKLHEKPVAEWTEEDVQKWMDETGRYHKEAPESGRYSVNIPGCAATRWFAADTMELADRVRKAVEDSKKSQKP